MPAENSFSGHLQGHLALRPGCVKWWLITRLRHRLLKPEEASGEARFEFGSLLFVPKSVIEHVGQAFSDDDLSFVCDGLISKCGERR